MIFDSHVHLNEVYSHSPEAVEGLQALSSYGALSSVFSEGELCKSLQVIDELNLNVMIAAGIHPQNPDRDLLPFLEEALKNKRVRAVGEIGFDFFNEGFRSSFDRQKEVFESCLDLALFHDKGIVVHNRKAWDRMFPYASKLKKLPFVIFHGFGGTEKEAFSMMNKGVNAFFSFGKNLLKGQGRSSRCISALPVENLLLETDAPFMTLQSQEFSRPEEILDVYREAAAIRKTELDEFESLIEKNVRSLGIF